MRARHWIFAGAAISGLGAMAMTGLAQQRPPMPPQPGWPQNVDRERYAERWLVEVRNAADPSSVVEAYARAREALQHDVAAEREYVERMVALGLPEMTEVQARDVVAKRPREGVSRAVIAYMDARRGNDLAGLAGIVQAAQLAPDARFVQRTAGQLTAWYDVRADRRQIPQELAVSVEWMRRQMRRSLEFNEAYRRARSAYRDDWSERGLRAGGPYRQEVWSDPVGETDRSSDPWRPDAWRRLWDFGPGVRTEGPLPRDDDREPVPPPPPPRDGRR